LKKELNENRKLVNSNDEADRKLKHSVDLGENKSIGEILGLES
jgi:hypothetical protein